MLILETGFNSILVRLKELTTTWTIQSGIEFQFHTGSIKRKQNAANRIYDIRFNSILVRLKG